MTRGKESSGGSEPLLYGAAAVATAGIGFGIKEVKGVREGIVKVINKIGKVLHTAGVADGFLAAAAILGTVAVVSTGYWLHRRSEQKAHA